MDPKTVRRYARAGEGCGLAAGQGEGALTDEVLNAILGTLCRAPARQHGEAWQQCQEQRAFIEEKLGGRVLRAARAQLDPEMHIEQWDPSSKVTYDQALGILPPEILRPVLTVYAVIVYPEVLRRALAYGEGFALLRPRASFTAIARRPLEYAATVAGAFVALLVLAAGFNMCLLGAIVSVPLAYAAVAHQVARWHACVESPDAPAASPYRG